MPVPAMVTTHEGGLKFATEIRGHRVLVDQPGPGRDEAPTPLELMGASIGSCVALYVQQFCHSRGLPYEGMRVETTLLGAQNPNRIGRFEVAVTLAEAVPEEYEELLERVARSCPAHHTLVQGSEVAVRIHQPETAAA